MTIDNSSDMVERSVTVVNELGLHARAAARFVNLATKFESHITIGRNSKVMDGKSILGILLLAASRGTTLRISAEGADEQAAVDALVQLVESGFGEAAAGKDSSGTPSAAPDTGDKWNG